MMKFVRRWGLLSIASVLAVVTVSCTSGEVRPAARQEQAAAAPAAVEVMLSEFKIDPSTIAVPVGQPIDVLGDEHGPGPAYVRGRRGRHDVRHDLIDPGTTVVLEVPALDAGTYAAYCTVSGHEDLGMLATVTAGAATGATGAAGASSSSMSAAMMAAMHKAGVDAFLAGNQTARTGTSP